MLATERVDQPVALAQQIADLFQLRQSEGRAKSLQSTVGTTSPPSRRAARTSSSSSWPPPRNRPSRSSRP
jgi:outer membrane PBP1 activator LpoA protein